MSSRHKTDEKVQVTVRCRPTNHSERQRKIRKVVECNSKNKEVSITTSSSSGFSASHQTKSYSFDKVFGPNTTQLEVYKSVVESQLQDVLAGYNCTVFAYGQTGTGKTYTMEGERSVDDDYSWDTDPRAGIIPRTLSQLFDCLEKAGCEFSVRVSLLEIYNEEIYDLLSPSNDMRKMKIYEDNNKKVVVSGLTEVHVRHKSDVYQILRQGAIKRRTAATNLNEFSSRSHSVFSVTVHTKDITHNNMEEEELVKIGKLNLVDLAGSENIGRSGAVDKHAREAGSINQSLLTLGRCITALVDRTPHIPYRESKLTRLLQDSLGGTTKTSMIATISPGSDNYDETMSTLEYAARAKNIHNKPRVNQKLTKRALIKEYDDEIERLRREVVAMRQKNGVYVEPEKYDEMVLQIENLTTAVKQREEQASEYKELFSNASTELDARTEELRSLTEDLLNVRQDLSEQRFLKDVHAEHGQKVVKYASGILKTTSAVTEDIVQVHNKVDRVKQVNENNVNTFRSFSEKVKFDVNSMRSETFSVLDESRNNVQEILDSLSSYKVCNSATLDNVTSFIREIRGVTADVHRSNSEVLTEWNTNLVENVDQQSDLVKKHNDTMLQHCQHSYAKLKQVDHIIDSLLHVMDKYKEFSSFHCQEMESHARMTDLHVDEIKKQIDSMNSTLNQYVEEENNEKIAIKELLKKANDRLTKMEEQTNKRVKIRGENTSIITDMTVAYKKQSDDILNSYMAQTKLSKTELLDTLKSSRKSLKTYAGDQKQDIVVMKETCVNHTAELTNHHHHVKEDGRSLVETCKQKFESANNAAQKLQEQCLDVLREMRVDVDEHVEKISENTSAMDEDLDAIKLIQDEGNRKVVEVAHQYAIDKVEKVIPTGMTPARKVYQYSREIPQPPIEEEVLIDFREKLLELDSQEEEEEEEKEENVLDERLHEEEEENVAENLEDSITIPDVGGLPFFKRTTRSRAKIHPAATKKLQSRIPLKPVHNINSHHGNDA